MQSATLFWPSSSSSNSLKLQGILLLSLWWLTSCVAATWRPTHSSPPTCPWELLPGQLIKNNNNNHVSGHWTEFHHIEFRDVELCNYRFICVCLMSAFLIHHSTHRALHRVVFSKYLLNKLIIDCYYMGWTLSTFPAPSPTMLLLALMDSNDTDHILIPWMHHTFYHQRAYAVSFA